MPETLGIFPWFRVPLVPLVPYPELDSTPTHSGLRPSCVEGSAPALRASTEPPLGIALELHYLFAHFCRVNTDPKEVVSWSPSVDAICPCPESVPVVGEYGLGWFDPILSSGERSYRIPFATKFGQRWGSKVGDEEDVCPWGCNIC